MHTIFVLYREQMGGSIVFRFRIDCETTFLSENTCGAADAEVWREIGTVLLSSERKDSFVDDS